MNEEMTLEALAERMSGDSSAPYYIAGVLREAIYRGILPEGKSLHQAQLALRLGVSPIPLREALRLLETEGLVAFQGYRGAVVTALSVEEARELYEMVSALETSLLRIAFPKITRRILQEAASTLDEMEKTEDCIRWRDLNQMFHNLFYEPADRPLTLDNLARLRQKTDRMIRICPLDLFSGIIARFTALGLCGLALVSGVTEQQLMLGSIVSRRWCGR